MKFVLFTGKFKSISVLKTIFGNWSEAHRVSPVSKLFSNNISLKKGLRPPIKKLFIRHHNTWELTIPKTINAEASNHTILDANQEVNFVK